MEASNPIAKLCEICSKLDTQLLAHPLYPCHNPLPCSDHPNKRVYFGGDTSLGSIDEIKSRRSTCDICKLIAECLDKEPSDLTGECRITETEQYCSFTLRGNIKAADPSITHFHLTHATVIIDTPVPKGPVLPWEVKKRDEEGGHYVMHFQTKARSFLEPGEPTPVSMQSEQEFLETVGGRYVGTQASTQLIREWLHECEREHGKDCMPSMQLQAELRYKEPAFVVDVIHSCLVDTLPQCRYIALSYVWGRAAVFKHLLENSQDLRKTGSFRLLPIPATIRDAMSLVHAIGERYLWVDSLCIVQDDLKMQQSEIMRMGSIYSSALFTIIAAAGDHANNGLPGVEPGSREQVQKILKLGNCELLTVIDVPKTQNGFDNTVWGSRAWTFQERALSNRVLVFSENQVYWSCRVASHSEERALENVRVLERYRLSFPQTQQDDSLSWQSLQPFDYCNLYDDLLYIYRQRRLTYQVDTLNAFSGVTEVLAALQSDTFFWGLPGSFFSYAMTWELTGRSSRNYIEIPIFGSDGTKEMIPVPSWSWAAWTGRDSSSHLSDLKDIFNDTVVPLIHFSIVDSKRQLVMIKERSGHEQDHPDRVRALWQGAQSHQLPCLPPHYLPQVGQLCFWTSAATLKVIRSCGVGARGIYYTFDFPDSQPDSDATVHDADIVDQEFIVIAARSGNQRLILLAIEWKDEVAYRVAKEEIDKAAWLQAENRQWRLITLG